jgi:outer membrane immunogenic protein
MKTKIALAALIAATATAAPAQTGLRADIHAGWDKATTHQRTDVGTSGATTKISEDGIIYGGEIGYDQALGGFRLGVYAGAEGASVRRCSEVFTEVETCAKAGRNLTLGVRAGADVAPGVLLYAKGGYSNGQLRVDYIDHVTSANSFGIAQDMDGYHLGAGVQIDLMSNVYAKLEYVRTDYEDYALEEGDATISGGIDRDNVIVGIGVRF